MKFEEIIEQVSPIFLSHGFEIVESSKNFIKFDSDRATFTIAFDPRENSFYTHCGRKNAPLCMLSSDLLTDVFHEEISSYKNRSYSDILIYFLKEKGNLLLKGDKKIFTELESYSKNKAREYTDKIILQQKLKYADSAWTNKHYSKFIECINSIDKSLLKGSYLKKYQIALQKLKNI